MLVPPRSVGHAPFPLCAKTQRTPLLACLAVSVILLAGCGSSGPATNSSGGNTPSVAPTATQRPPYIYVAIGASETFGTGADNPKTQNYPADLSVHLPQGTRLDNLGYPGWTAEDALSGELPIALDDKPDLVTVWLGTNDILQQVSLTDYQRSMDSILKQLSADGHPHIAVANIPNLVLLPRFYSADQTALTATIQQMNAVVAHEVSTYHDILVDVYTHTSEVLGHPDYLSGDGLHPSTLGYQLIANLFYEVLMANGVI